MAADGKNKKGKTFIHCNVDSTHTFEFKGLFFSPITSLQGGRVVRQKEVQTERE